MFTSLKKIQAYIDECEQKRLDLDNEVVWSKTYLPAERTTKARGHYEGVLPYTKDMLVVKKIGCKKETVRPP